MSLTISTSSSSTLHPQRAPLPVASSSWVAGHDALCGAAGLGSVSPVVREARALPLATSPQVSLRPGGAAVHPTTEKPGEAAWIGACTTLAGVMLTGVGVGAAVALAPMGVLPLSVGYCVGFALGVGLGLASTGATVLAVYFGYAAAYTFIIRHPRIDASTVWLSPIAMAVAMLGIISHSPLAVGLSVGAMVFVCTAVQACAAVSTFCRPSLPATMRFWQQLAISSGHPCAVVDTDTWGLSVATATTLNAFLWRLTATKDYEYDACRAGLGLRVMELLAAMDQDAQLRDTCLDVMYHSFTSCGDGTTVSMNQLELAVRVHKARTSKNSEEALMGLARSLIKLEAVHSHVSTLAARRRWSENVEYRLAFETKLARLLKLPVSASHMLYPMTVALNPMDLANAAVAAEQAATDSVRVNAFLQTWAPWQQHLREKHAALYANWLDVPLVPFDAAADDSLVCPLTQESHTRLVHPVIFRSGDKIYLYEHDEFRKYWVQRGEHLDQNGMRVPLASLDKMCRIEAHAQAQA